MYEALSLIGENAPPGAPAVFCQHTIVLYFSFDLESQHHYTQLEVRYLDQVQHQRSKHSLESQLMLSQSVY